MDHWGHQLASVGSSGLDSGPQHLDIKSQSSGGIQGGKPTLHMRSYDAETYANAFPPSKKLLSGLYTHMVARTPRLRPRTPGVGMSTNRPPPGRSSGHGTLMAGHMIVPSNRQSPALSRPESPARVTPPSPFYGNEQSLNTVTNGHSPSQPRRSRLDSSFLPTHQFYESSRSRSSRYDRSKYDSTDVLTKVASHPSLLALANGEGKAEADDEGDGHSASGRSRARRPTHGLSGIGENALHRSATRTRFPITSEIQPYVSRPRTPHSRGRTPVGSYPGSPRGRSRHSPVGTRYHTPVGTHSEVSGTSGISSPRRSGVSKWPATPTNAVKMHTPGHTSPDRESRWSREGFASDEEELQNLRSKKYQTEYEKHHAQLLAEEEKAKKGAQTPEEKKKEEEKKEEERRRKGMTSTKPWVAGSIALAGIAGLLGVGSSTAAVIVSEDNTHAAEKSTDAALAQVAIGQAQANASWAQVNVQSHNVDQAIKQVAIQTKDEQYQKQQAQAALAQVKINQQNANASSQNALINTQEESIQVAQMKIAAQQAATALAVAQKGGANITAQVPLPGLPAPGMRKRFSLPRKYLADKVVYYGSDKTLMLRDIAARNIAPMERS